MRPADAPPLDLIRSLAYFLPVIDEVLGLHVSQDYFQHLRHKLERLHAPPIDPGRPSDVNARASGADDGKPTRTPAAWMILLACLSPPTKHAFGVDNACQRSPTPSPVLRAGHFNRALLGHSCEAPKVPKVKMAIG